MRISRKKRPDKPLIPIFRINNGITNEMVRVIDAESKNIGVLTIAEALKLAADNECDLVEINPKAEPPVVQIVEFKHFKYQKEKEARKQKAHAHVSEVKGIRLSIRIGEHDLAIRKEQGEKFLERGDKVKVEIILRGAERAKRHLAFETITNYFNLLNAGIPVKYEQEAAAQGNKVIATIVRK